MKHKYTPPLFSFSLAYVVAILLFGLVLSIILAQTVAAADGVTANSAEANQSGPTRAEHQGYRHERLSPEEREARIDAKFSEIDTNSDDLISKEELAAADLPHPRKGKHFGGRHHGGGGGDREGGRNNDAANSDERAHKHAEKRAEMEGKLFEALDSDSDGTLSKEELAEMHAVRQNLMKQLIFQRMDENEDGFLSRDEFPPQHRR